MSMLINNSSSCISWLLCSAAVGEIDFDSHHGCFRSVDRSNDHRNYLS
jgi:hypothetical protein